jgi:enoyl-CoA hydratase/carnithine racemase
MMTAEHGVRVESRGAVDILAFGRAERLNALDPQTIEALCDYFEALHAQPQVRVVILRSEGRAFCSGADLGSTAFAADGEGRAHRQAEVQRRYSRLIRLMRSCPQPIIALAQGAACGAGFSLLLASDIRHAAPEARMNAAYLRIGLGGCDLGAGYLLPRLVGLSRASELLLTGRFIDAAQAQAIGLVSEVVPAARLLATALKTAEDMLSASPMGLRMTKESLNALIDAPGLEAALLIENRQQVILTGTQDHQEAMAARREKRSPAYRDC